MEKSITINLPELGAVAATRGAIGVGIGLLLANKLSAKQRKAIGLPLFIVGALSTIPIARHIFHKNKNEPDPTVENKQDSVSEPNPNAENEQNSDS